jgi:hypothetical protein
MSSPHNLCKPPAQNDKFEPLASPELAAPGACAFLVSWRPSAAHLFVTEWFDNKLAALAFENLASARGYQVVVDFSGVAA